MTPREVMGRETDSPAKVFTWRELVLRGKTNWPAAIFFACICALHLYVAVHSFRTSLWEGYTSSFLALGFLLVTALCIVARGQISICPLQRVINIRTGVGKFWIDRDVSFSDVRSVRVTLWKGRRHQHSRVEILCDGEEIPCPHTPIPCQQALYLAMVMNVRLVKICDDRAHVGDSSRGETPTASTRVSLGSR